MYLLLHRKHLELKEQKQKETKPKFREKDCVFIFHILLFTLFVCCFYISIKKRKHLCLLLQDDPIAHNFDQSVNVDSSGMKNNSEYHLEMSTWELYSKNDIFDGLQPIIRVNTKQFIPLIYNIYLQ